MAYIGNEPGVSSQRVVSTFTATSGQTTFTPISGYTLGYIDVYLNGIKLVDGDDYTAANGMTVALASGAAVGDSVECVAFFPRGLSDGYLKSEADARYVGLTGDQTIAGVKTFSGSATIVNGNLGIGTSSPQVQLHLQSSAPVIRLTDTSASTDAEIFCNSAAGSMYLRADHTNVAANSVIGFQIDGSDKMTLDTSGNLGLGVTPSAWNSGSKAIQIGAQGAIEYRGNATSIATNAYYDSVGYKYIASNAASLYYQYLGKHVWGIASSGTAGNAISFTEAMTLNASGELLLGTTSNIGVGAKAAFYSSGNVLHIQSSSAGANNFVSYNSSGSASLTIANNGFVSSNSGIQATCGSSTTGLIVAQNTGASATQYGRFTANSADVSIGQNIATSPGNWSKIDNAVASSGWVFNGRTATLWTSAAGDTTPLVYLPFLTDQYGNVHIDGGSTTFQLNSTDHAHTLGSITAAPSTLSRLNIQERAGNWISWVNGSGGFYGAVYLSGSTVVYGGSSDYRLKENIRPIKDATTRLMQLKPVTFDWIESKQTAEGFIAHELQEVVPDAVAGEKDGINELGDPKWQAVDKSFVVPLLTKALQELREEFDAYRLAHP